jgi:hypothetical protein
MNEEVIILQHKLDEIETKISKLQQVKTLLSTKLAFVREEISKCSE